MEEKETNRPQEKKPANPWILDHPWLCMKENENFSYSVDEEIRFSLDEIRMA